MKNIYCILAFIAFTLKCLKVKTRFNLKMQNTLGISDEPFTEKLLQ